MAMAGLWDAWKEPKQPPDAANTWLQSFSIITTEANELMSTIHIRMPVILREHDWQEWLDRDDSRPPPVHLPRSDDSDEMAMAPCNKSVGNVRNNGPEMPNNS